MELQLKYFVLKAPNLWNESGELFKTHDLRTLWQKSRKLLERLAAAEDIEEINHVERILMELAKLDENIDRFRYPVSLKHGHAIPGIGNIHMRRFHEAMEEVAEFLDAMDTALRVYLEQEHEIDEYYRDASAGFYGE